MKMARKKQTKESQITKRKRVIKGKRKMKYHRYALINGYDPFAVVS